MPALSTLATLESDEHHVTVAVTSLLRPPPYRAVAESCCDWPTSSDGALGETVMVCSVGGLEGVDGWDVVDEDPEPPPHAVNARQEATVNKPRILEMQRISNSPEELRPKIESVFLWPHGHVLLRESTCTHSCEVHHMGNLQVTHNGDA